MKKRSEAVLLRDQTEKEILEAIQQNNLGKAAFLWGSFEGLKQAVEFFTLKEQGKEEFKDYKCDYVAEHEK